MLYFTTNGKIMTDGKSDFSDIFMPERMF